MANNNSSGGGVGITTVLFLIFLVLKLTHVINWSWWAVTAPLWIGAALWLAIVALVLLVLSLKGEL